MQYWLMGRMRWGPWTWMCRLLAHNSIQVTSTSGFVHLKELRSCGWRQLSRPPCDPLSPRMAMGRCIHACADSLIAAILV